MKNLFPSYFPPSEVDISSMWAEALFVVDANVLLNQYRYTEKTRNEVFAVFSQLGDRLWIPNQVAKEYLHNRPSVMLEQGLAFDTCLSALQAVRDNVEKLISDKLQFEYHPFIDKAALARQITTAVQVLEEDISGKKDGYTESIDADEILVKIASIFEGRLGGAYDSESFKAHCEAASNRYERSIPPGYEDAKKGDGRQYGDYLLWRQCLDKAVESKQPMIFVTNDRKKDWWWITKGRTVGPRIELIDEMRREADVSFYMYRSERFLELAAKYLRSTVDDEAIREVENVRKEKDRFDLGSLARMASPIEPDEFSALSKYPELAQVISASPYLKEYFDKRKEVEGCQAAMGALEAAYERLNGKVGSVSRPTLSEYFNEQWRTALGSGFLTGRDAERGDD